MTIKQNIITRGWSMIMHNLAPASSNNLSSDWNVSWTNTRPETFNGRKLVCKELFHENEEKQTAEINLESIRCFFPLVEASFESFFISYCYCTKLLQTTIDATITTITTKFNCVTVIDDYKLNCTNVTASLTWLNIMRLSHKGF